MKIINWLTIVLLLISFFVHGQGNETVKVVTGRGSLNKAETIMDLSYRNLNKVPIIALNRNIETLILDNNNIKELPLWLSDLENLKILSIRNNSLVKVDYVISRCANLEQLYLSGNKDLSDISNIISSQKLELIDVVDTKINELPSWIQMMDNLFYFKYTEKK